MAQVKPFKFDAAGFPSELDTALDDLTVNSLTVDSGISMGSSKITGLAAGTVAGDAVNKSQLDSLAAGFDRKESVRVATVAALPAYVQAGAGVGATLTASAVGILAVDGVNTVLGDRILVKDGAAGADNGIYEVTTEGTAGVAFVLTRATDADADADVTAGMFTFVTEGSTIADTGWFITTNDPITVDTTAIAFSQFAGVGTFTGGDGIDITAGVVSVDLVATGALEFVTGELAINLEATNPTLDIVSTELGVKFSTTAGGLDQDAGGLKVKVDGVTIQINGSGQLEVIGTGSVDQYSLTAGAGGVTIGDPIYVSANDTGLPIDNTSNNSRKYVGVAAETIAATNPFKVQQEGIVTPASIGGAPAAGDIVWADTPSGVTVTLPTGVGTHRLVVGKMKNATQYVIEPQYIAKLT